MHDNSVPLESTLADREPEEERIAATDMKEFSLMIVPVSGMFPPVIGPSIEKTFPQ
jgi:hypothetical protein